MNAHAHCCIGKCRRLLDLISSKQNVANFCVCIHVHVHVAIPELSPSIKDTKANLSLSVHLAH